MSSLKPPLVIDLGRKRKKSIRNLKAGTGKLMSEVDRTVEALRANGATLGDGAPLVLVVERKDKRAERRRKARKLQSCDFKRTCRFGDRTGHLTSFDDSRRVQRIEHQVNYCL